MNIQCMSLTFCPFQKDFLTEAYYFYDVFEKQTGPGDVFGSNIRKPIGKMNKSLFEVQTLTYSDLHCIKLETLVSALQLFPDFFKKFKKELLYSFDITRKV